MSISSSDAAERRGLGSLARWAVGLVLTLAAVEILFRLVIFPQWGDVGFTPFVRHPVYGTFQKPNLDMRRYNPPNYDVRNHTNSQGFRDREQGFGDDLRGVWVAGGSNSYAAFVEDDQTYASRLQAMGIPTALLASEGHRMPDQAKVMKDLARRGFRPRAVLVEVTVYNHLFDYRPALAEFDRPLPPPGRAGAAVPVTPAHNLAAGLRNVVDVVKGFDLTGVKGRLISNSAFYCWLKTGINGIPAMRDLTLRLGLRADPDLALGAPVELLDKDGHDYDDWYESLADYALALSHWTERTLHVPFAMMVVPSRFQLEPERFASYLRHYHLDPARYDPALPYRRTVAALRRRNIPVFTAGDVLEPAGRPLAFPDDGHMNARAHDVVAHGLAAWMPTALGIGPQP